MRKADVIKYEGDNTTFVWKSPCTDFSTMTQCIVHDSQEAIFMLDGKALDVLGPGIHTLETKNIPLITRFLNLPVKGKYTFHCEVYYINQTEQMAIPWGLNPKLDYVDPKYHIPLQIGISGNMSLRVIESRKLIVKLVGTENALSQKELVEQFRGIINAKAKPYIARAIALHEISILDIDQHLDQLSETVKESIQSVFDDYGFEVVQFHIETILKPTENNSSYQQLLSIQTDRSVGLDRLKYEQEVELIQAGTEQQIGLIQARTDAEKTAIAAQGRAAARKAEGYTYQEERKFDIAAAFASNEATNEYTNLGLGIGSAIGMGGAMLGVGRTFGNLMGESLESCQPTVPNQTMKENCTHCGAQFEKGAKFCPECGITIVRSQKVICSRCGRENENAKFCIECGAALNARCPQCNAEVGTAKFCPQCGAKL